MSDEEEHESRCGESFPMCALNPQRSTTTGAMGSARSSRRGFGLRLRSVVTSVP